MQINYGNVTYGNVTYVGPRRGRARQMRKIRDQHLEAQADAFTKEQAAQEIFEKMRASNVPEELVNMLSMYLSQAIPRVPDLPSDEELGQNELEMRAEQFAGSFMQTLPNGTLQLLDFTSIVQPACQVDIVPPHTELVSQPGVSLQETDTRREVPLSVLVMNPMGGRTTLYGAAAEAFIRYLHYIGIFQLQAAKVKCPTCSEPCDCPECGGLGWVLKTEKPSESGQEPSENASRAFEGE